MLLLLWDVISCRQLICVSIIWVRIREMAGLVYSGTSLSVCCNIVMEIWLNPAMTQVPLLVQQPLKHQGIPPLVHLSHRVPLGPRSLQVLPGPRSLLVPPGPRSLQVPPSPGPSSPGLKFILFLIILQKKETQTQELKQVSQQQILKFHSLLVLLVLYVMKSI